MIARLLISPSIERRKEEIKTILASHITRGLIAQGSGNANHPDLLYIKEGEKLGIAEARKIKEHFSLKPYSAKGRIVVLEDADVLTIEAQNALLKTLEELPQEAMLILSTSSDANLLPTILSRCQISHLQETNPAGSTHQTRGVKPEDIEKLLNSSIEERFAFIEKLRDKEEFLHSMTYFFRQQLLKSTLERSVLKGPTLKFLQELLQAEEWAKQNVNIRAILEYLMLVMPHGK